MRLWQRFASSKKARIAALAILGFAIFSYAAIILVSEIFGAGDDEGKVYRKLEGDRVLLMSTDNNSYCVISNQSWDCLKTIPNLVSYWERRNTVATTLTGLNLLLCNESVLYRKNDDAKWWHLINCRHGNTFPSSNTAALQTYQNYLPYSSTAKSCKSRNANIVRSTAGQVIMQNTPDAQIVSACYEDGIGTIYFDCVNGFTGYKDSKISVEVAYGVWKTNAVGIVESREFPKDVEFYDNGVPVPPNEKNAHEIMVDVDGNLQTNEYARCAWVKANMTGKYWSGSEYDIAVTKELKLELPLSGQSAGNMDNFGHRSKMRA